MDNYKISIIIPVYNVEKYIERCLLSVYRQTYKNIEVLIIDDCGQDGSMKKAQDIVNVLKEESRTVILHNEKNYGLSVARNSGTYNASGEYIFYLDSDDELVSDCIESLVELAYRYPGVELIHGNMNYVSGTYHLEEERKEGYNFENFPEYTEDTLWITRYYFDFTEGFFIPTTAVNKLIKRDFILSNNLFFMEGIIHEDEKMVFDIEKCVRRIAFKDKITYIHYANLDSIMISDSNYNSIYSWLVILKEVISNLCGNYIKLKQAYCLSILKDQIFRIKSSSPKNKLVKDSKWLTFIFLKHFIKKNLCKESILLLCLLLLPMSFRKISIVKHSFHKVFSLEFLIVFLKCF